MGRNECPLNIVVVVELTLVLYAIVFVREHFDLKGLDRYVIPRLSACLVSNIQHEEFDAKVFLAACELQRRAILLVSEKAFEAARYAVLKPSHDRIVRRKEGRVVNARCLAVRPDQ